MYINKLKIIFFLSIFFFSLQGCMKEDLSNCIAESQFNIDIQFDYHGDGSGSIFGESIDNVDSYIFDKDGVLVEIINQNKGDITDYSGLHHVLPVGKYTFFNVANVKEFTTILDSDKISTARVKARHFTRQTSAPKCVDNLYSCITEVVISGNSNVQAKGTFQSSHIDIELYVKNGTDNKIPIIKVNNLPEMMNFNMSLEQSTTTYHPEMVYDNDKKAFASTFQTLRFTAQHPVEIAIESGEGILLHNVYLQKFIVENNLLPIYDKQESKIEILVEVSGTQVEISIPNWNNEDLIPN